MIVVVASKLTVTPDLHYQLITAIFRILNKHMSPSSSSKCKESNFQVS